MQCIKCNSPIPESPNKLCVNCEEQLRTTLFSKPKRVPTEESLIPTIVPKETKIETSNGQVTKHENLIMHKSRSPFSYLALFFIILATLVLGILIGIFFYYPALK